jgi:hypothetical protein
VVATRGEVGVAREDSVAGDDVTARRPWYDTVELWAGIAVVAICCAYVLSQLRPGLLILDTTAAGGDTGAHVWFPAFLRDHLLPWRLTGWAPDYYAGFPAGQFYFPFPALLIVGLDVVVPFNVAFKLVTALGAVAAPAAAYVFGRGIRAPRPAPALFAVAATAFLFFKDGGDAIMRFDHHIMGGTITSTLAGEYSFTIALALALCFLGSLARALEVSRPLTRVNLWLPALLLAATATSHLVVAVFAVYGAVVLWLVRRPLRSFTRAAATIVVGGLLTAVWSLPLAASLGYTTDMRYEPVGTGYTDPWLLGRLGIRLPAWFDWLFISEMWFLFPLALVALGAGIAYRRRATLDVAGILLAAGVVFCSWELLRDVFGKAPAWNLRLLPFWYLMLYLLAALGAAELARWSGSLAAWTVFGREPRRDDDTAPRVASDETARGAVRVVAIVVVLAVFATVALVRVHATRGYITYWAKYNYTGYEGGLPEDLTQKSWPEYRAFIDTAGALPSGRMLWEPTSDIGKYGTPLALMLLPYWTDGRIDSMEGLYYEAAGSTGYHFLAAATLALQPSNAVRGLPYRTIADFDLGVRYLQLLGVRYYAATSADANARAAAEPALRVVARVPDLDGVPPSGWTIYEVDEASLVTPVAFEPVVGTGLREAPNYECNGTRAPEDGYGVAELGPWECLGVPWFNDPDALDRPLAADGPSTWARAPMLEARDEPKTALPSIDVSNVRATDERIEFDVSRPGVPVLVKTSYYPNWQASGADGPWRATPNFMIVVPTEKHVVLTYGTTRAEWAGRLLTLVGLVGVAALAWWGGVRRTLPWRRSGAPSHEERRRHAG